MSLDPYRQTLAIASDFRRGGGRIVKSNVVGLEADGGRIRSVRTDSGTIRAQRVVLCAGAWSAELLRPLGYNVPLETQRGYHIMVAGSNAGINRRSEEHTSELQSLMRISYAVFCLKKKTTMTQK